MENRPIMSSLRGLTLIKTWAPHRTFKQTVEVAFKSMFSLYMQVYVSSFSKNISLATKVRLQVMVR